MPHWLQALHVASARSHYPDEEGIESVTSQHPTMLSAPSFYLAATTPMKRGLKEVRDRQDRLDRQQRPRSHYPDEEGIERG